MKMTKRAWIGGGCAAVLCAWGAIFLVQPVGAQGQPGPSTPPRAPAFTQAQADAGAAAYKQNCASCHGAGLEGEHLAPALSGERFDRTWRGRPAGSLMFPEPGAFPPIWGKAWGSP